MGSIDDVPFELALKCLINIFIVKFHHCLHVLSFPEQCSPTKAIITKYNENAIRPRKLP